MQLGLSIPLFDEGASVVPMVDHTLATLEAAGISAVLALVDNGSRDDTRARIHDLALRHGSRVLPVLLDENAGYGGGILAGLASLTAGPQPEAIGWMWGDGQVDPAVLPHLLADLAEADVAKAHRTARHDGWQRRLIGAVYGWLMRTKGVRTRDIHGCPKIFRREVLRRLAPQSQDWWIDAEVILAAEAAGMRIASRPVVMEARQGGHSKVNGKTVLFFVRKVLGLA